VVKFVDEISEFSTFQIREFENLQIRNITNAISVKLKKITQN